MAASPFNVSTSGRMCLTYTYLFGFKQTKPNCASESTDFLFELLKNCNWSTTVLIGDSNYIPTLQELLILNFHNHKYPTIYFDNSSTKPGVTISISDIRRFYVDDKVRNFIVILENPVVVLNYLEQVFTAEERGRCALMPHSVRLVVILLESDLTNTRERLRRFVFDNVAVITVRSNEMVLDGMYTLMWRRNRTRELSVVNTAWPHKSKVRRDICQLFPNAKFGFNRRRLLVLAKEWLLHMYKEPVPGTTEMRFVGFYMDVTRLLAESINFTFQVIPKPGEDDNMSWDDFSNKLGSSAVDLGATTFPISTSAYYNHTVSFPLLCSNITGIYLNHESQGSSLPKIQNIFIMAFSMSCAVLFNVVIYSIATRAANSAQLESKADVISNEKHILGKELKNNESSEKSRFDHSKDESLSEKCASSERDEPCVICDVNNKDKRIPSNVTAREPLLVLKYKCCGQSSLRFIFQNIFSDIRGVQFYEYFVDIFFRFVGTLVNQNTFQIPQRNAARVLLFFWNMMVLVLSATFTGTLIANLVGRGETLPFTTLEEMMARGDYRWSCESESSAMRLMQGAPQGSIMNKLYAGVQRYATENKNFNGTMMEIINRLKNDKFVAIVTGPWQENLRARFLPNLQSIGENLLVTCSGMVMPPSSELEGAISQKLLVMADTGLIDYAMKKIRNNSRSEGRALDQEEVFDVTFMEPIFFLCCYGISAAVLVLIVECVCGRWNILRRCGNAC